VYNNPPIICIRPVLQELSPLYEYASNVYILSHCHSTHVCRPLTNQIQTVWHVPLLLRTSDEWLFEPQFSELDFIGQFHESWHTTV